MRRLVQLFVLSFLFGCPRTESPPVDPYVPPEDGGTGDAAVIPDAGVGCTITGTCPSGQYCGPEDRCIARPTSCMTTSECALDDVCSAGKCIAHPEACPCADPIEVCLAAGFCAPGFKNNVPDARRCAIATDCGPAGICDTDVCAPCGALPCPGNLDCDFGYCFERGFCEEATDCYAGNTCEFTFCTRSTEDCTETGNDDSIVTATPLLETFTAGGTICGDSDVDYYKIEVPAATGARFVITSTRSQATIEARVSDTSGRELANVATLALAGVTIIDFAGDVMSTGVVLEISSRDSSGAYSIDTQLHPLACAGDGLDLYGDGDSDHAMLLGRGETAHTICIGDDDWRAIDIFAGEAIDIIASWDGDLAANVDIDVYDSSLRLIASGSSDEDGRERVNAIEAVGGGRVFFRVYTRGAPTFGVPYTLLITASRGIACRDAEAIDLSVQPGASITGNLRAAYNISGPDCGGATIPALSGDRIYKITPPAPPSVITASIRQLGGGSTSTVAIAVISDCERDETLLDCAVSPQPFRRTQLSVERSNAEPVFLVVTSESFDDDIDYELEVRADTPRANDRCTTAIALSEGLLNAGTIGAIDDLVVTATSAGCQTLGRGAGPDRFYTLTLGPGERAALELIGEGSGFLWVSTSTACAEIASTCTASSLAELGSRARVSLAATATTTYAVIVDGEEAAYQLRVVREPALVCVADSECSPAQCDEYMCVAPPSNDTCASPINIPITDNFGSIVGSTGAANNDYEPRCAPRALPDVVYSVRVPAGTAGLVARIEDASFDPVLAIRTATTACQNFPDLVCNDDEGYPPTYFSRAVLRNPPAGEYRIIVDAYNGEGPFLLEVDLIPGD